MDKRNYLDVVFAGIIENCQVVREPLTDDTYFAVLIPNKGQTLLDVISEGMSGLILNDICVVRSKFSNTNKVSSPVYNYDYGKIVLSFKPFNTQSGNTFATLSTAYKFIDSVFVPVVSIHHNSGSAFVELRVNTMSDETDSPAVNKSGEPKSVPKELDESTPYNNGGGESFTPFTEYFDNSKFLTSNRMYIYVSNSNYQDFTSMLRGKSENDKNEDANKVANPLLSISYRGLDSLFPSQCLQLAPLV